MKCDELGHLYIPDHDTCECGEYDNPETRCWNISDPSDPEYGTLGYRTNKAPWFGFLKCYDWDGSEVHVFSWILEYCQCGEEVNC